ALENITANLSDSGPGLIMANKGDELKIIRKVSGDTYEVVLSSDPEAVSFYASRSQIVIH
ncbi:hypothetical protein, partial [Pseudomonas aeruginosa]|uniref:hypothetical protein n=1 Tax=Pseudomonas aeruginosa TaxID=287 RepID=UPI001CA5835C